MDYASIHHQFKALIADDQLDEAIELIVPVAERPDLHRETASSAINTLVYGALIPEQRFSESIAWLDDSIQGDFGYESWNSISNLGQVYLRLGQVERARLLFTTMIQSQYGPIDEATEFLDIINSGEAETLNSKRPDPRDSVVYKTLLSHLESSGENQEMADAFTISRGGATHGFIQGVLSSEGIQEINPTHDEIAQALWDYLTKEPLSNEPPYVESIEAIASGSATKAHARVVREAAFRGAPDAASKMYTYVFQNQGYADPWRNVAVVRGEVARQDTSYRPAAQTQANRPQGIKRF